MKNFSNINKKKEAPQPLAAIHLANKKRNEKGKNITMKQNELNKTDFFKKSKQSLSDGV